MVNSVSRAAMRSTRRVATVDGVPSAERADKVGARRRKPEGRVNLRQILRAPARPYPGTTIAEPLDLVANFLRQNDQT